MILEIRRIISGYEIHVPSKPLGDLEYERISRVIREKEEEIIRLKEQIRELLQRKSGGDITIYIERIRELEERINVLIIIEREHQGCQIRIRELIIEI